MKAKPPAPEILADALQDRIHQDLGPMRIAKSAKVYMADNEQYIQDLLAAYAKAQDENSALRKRCAEYEEELRAAAVFIAQEGFKVIAADIRAVLAKLAEGKL